MSEESKEETEEEAKKAPEQKQNLTPVIGAAFILVAVFAIYFIVTSGGEGPEGVGAQIPPPANVAAPPDDAERTRTGLASLVLEAGTGSVHPQTTSRVNVHYTGWTTDGQMFDSSVMRGESMELPLDGVIAGWTEGVKLMVEGERRRFWIPEELAYRGQDDMPAGMLVFDIQLIRIVD